MDQTEIQIKRSIEETRNAVGEKIDMIVNRVHNTIIGPKIALDNLVDSLNEYRNAIETTTSATGNGDSPIQRSVAETIERLKAFIHLIEQVKRDPWVMVTSSLFIGYVLGSIRRGDPRALRPARPQLQEGCEPQSQRPAAIYGPH